MRQNNPDILITGEVDESLVKEMIAKGFSVDVIPFIQTEIIRSKEIQQQIESVLQLNTTVVFTSANAVEIVKEYIQTQKPNWKIYCIGNTTSASVEKVYGKDAIVATADNAAMLAEIIITNKSSLNEVYFFCGDKRRNELPELLKKNGIFLNEIETYKTTILQYKIEKSYSAILFFSPSAVGGFFQNNTVNEKTVLFAIGNTTANEIKKYTNNTIVVSDKPARKELVEKVMMHFS